MEVQNQNIIGIHRSLEQSLYSLIRESETLESNKIYANGLIYGPICYCDDMVSVAHANWFL